MSISGEKKSKRWWFQNGNLRIVSLERRHSKRGTKSSFTSSTFFLDSIEITYPYTNLPGLKQRSSFIISTVKLSSPFNILMA